MTEFLRRDPGNPHATLWGPGAGPYGAPYGMPQLTTQELGQSLWYRAPQLTLLGATAAPVDVMTFVPFFTSGRPLVLNGLAFVTTALGTAGSKARAGIYRSSVSTLAPTQLVADGGEVATDAGPNLVLREATVPEVTLELHTLYWGAYVCGVAAPSVQSTGGIIPATFGDASGASGPARWWGFRGAFPYGPLPSQAPAAGLVSSAGGIEGAAVWFRFLRPG